jgi:hypothetical protein
LRRAGAILFALGIVGAGVVLAGCESTQDKAAKLQAQGVANAASQVPLTISKPDKSIKVLDSTLLHDENGDAIVVTLKNESKNTVVNAPILIDLIGAGGKSLGKNDAPGIDLTLNHVALMRPGETVEWVNDQLTPVSTPKSAKITVGPAPAPAPKGALPKIDVGPAELKTDPSGVEASGKIVNRSKIDQVTLSLYVVAHQGSKIVAAGRGAIKNLKVNKPTKYNLFFIGDPKGGKLTVTAPPSTLQ